MMIKEEWHWMLIPSLDLKWANIWGQDQKWEEGFSIGFFLEMCRDC